MPVGRIKWFNPDKGFGFIDMDDVDEDVFVHHSDVLQDDDAFVTFSKGDLVMFALERGERGLYASNVVRMKDT